MTAYELALNLYDHLRDWQIDFDDFELLSLPSNESPFGWHFDVRIDGVTMRVMVEEQ